MDSPNANPWEDLFFSPLTSAERAGVEGTAAYARYLRGARAVMESFDVPVGLTPKEEVWSLNKARLYRYTPVRSPEDRYPVPLLLVYALINKPFIFDLIPGRSFVEYMVEQGFDVYLLDWGSPGLEDKNTLLDDYVTEYLTRAVRRVLRVSGAKQISMMGYCIGATLATVYAARYPEAPLRNLILLTAPLDFSKSSEASLSLWVDERRMDVDKVIDTFGNVPGELIRQWAKLLRPVENFVGTYVNLMKLLDNEAAVWGWQAIHRWVEDVIPFAGEAFRQFVKVYIRENRLIQGKHVVAGKRVDLANIRVPLLNICAKYDHLVALDQSQSIMDLVSSEDKELRVIPAAHVGIMVSKNARYKLWPDLVEWLASRSG